MPVKISFGKKPPPPNSAFLKALSDYMAEITVMAKTAKADWHELKSQGVNGMDAYKAMHLKGHGSFSSMQYVRAVEDMSDRIGLLSVKHKPEWD